MTPEELRSLLRVVHRDLTQAMRGAVETELMRTVQRWQDAGSPAGVPWLRNAPGSQEDLQVLTTWTYLGADLVYSSRPWQAAAAEPLYALAVRMAHDADDQHPGLNLHKGIDYFMLGMARFHQGRYDEGAHNILIAVEEDRAAGLTDDQIVAAQQLGQHVKPWVRDALAEVAQLCRDAGHTFVTQAHIETMLDDMCRDQQDLSYRPVRLLWLHSSLRKVDDLPGPSPLTPVRRLEALQDLTFLYEAALRERHEQPGEPLRQLRHVVAKVRTIKGYPAAVIDDWATFANFDAADPDADADTKLTALQTEGFGGASDAERLCCQALLTVGLVRNMVHHRIDLQSTLLNAEYRWVLDRVLAALLLSW